MARKSIPRKMLGRKIKKVRLSKNLTQVQLAEKIGVSPKYISNIETGSGSCSLPTLVDIANTLNTSIDYLLSNVLNKNLETKFDSTRLNEVFNDLSDKQINYIVKMAQTMIESDLK